MYTRRDLHLHYLILEKNAIHLRWFSPVHKQCSRVNCFGWKMSWLTWNCENKKRQKILQASVSTYMQGNNITDKHKIQYVNSVQESYTCMFRWTCTCNKINVKLLNASCVSQQPWHYRTTNIKSRVCYF